MCACSKLTSTWRRGPCREEERTRQTGPRRCLYLASMGCRSCFHGTDMTILSTRVLDLRDGLSWWPKASRRVMQFEPNAELEQYAT
jgi:hypothetical protein